jgi:hypothetical protein
MSEWIPRPIRADRSARDPPGRVDAVAGVLGVVTSVFGP